MKDKICRICWNTNSWRCPGGDAAKLETDSFVHENGFGHEEWLFNYEWVLDGYMYGFLQPIGKHLETYAGDTCDILLYTFPPDSPPLWVGAIRHVEVLGNVEIEEVKQRFDSKGWMAQMREDVARVGGKVERVGHPTAAYIVNVRFRRENVMPFDPMLPVADAKAFGRKYHRYHPYDLKPEHASLLDAKFRGETAGVPDVSDPRRSEHERTRAAQEGASYSPQHVRLQNRLLKYLQGQFEPHSVEYEENFVDLAVRRPGHTTFYEIKLEKTAKRCIRVALGQLLEYAHYPNAANAQELIVVGDVAPRDEDRDYLEMLRQTYGLPVWYAAFDWESETLSELV